MKANDILGLIDPAMNKLFNSVGTALTVEQQLHVSAHWPKLAEWLATENGRIALQTFIGDWMASHNTAK
jgi:hypothetical protein